LTVGQKFSSLSQYRNWSFLPTVTVYIQQAVTKTLSGELLVDKESWHTKYCVWNDWGILHTKHI